MEMICFLSLFIIVLIWCALRFISTVGIDFRERKITWRGRRIVFESFVNVKLWEGGAGGDGEVRGGGRSQRIQVLPAINPYSITENNLLSFIFIDFQKLLFFHPSFFHALVLLFHLSLNHLHDSYNCGTQLDRNAFAVLPPLSSGEILFNNSE